MQRLLLTGFLFLTLTMQVSAQVEPPKPIPTPIASKHPPATLTTKAGDLVVLTIDSKGDVLFVWDEIAFPAKRIVQSGKVLYLTTPFNGVYTVQSVLLEEKTKYKTVITVTGGTDPPPGPPLPPVDDSLASLTAQIKALTATVNKLSNDTNAAYAKLDARIAALESPRPPPPPNPVDAFTKAVQDTYAVDPSPTKAASAAQLASLYKLSKPIVDDPSLTTIQTLFTRMHATAKLLPGYTDTTLLGVRNAIKAENDRLLGTTDKTLTTDLRATIWAQHQKTQSILEGLVK